MTTGFIKLNRSNETLELLNDPNAFILLTVIALRPPDRRVQRLQPPVRRGPHRRLQEVRPDPSAIPHRNETSRSLGLARFKPTTRGTVATLCGVRVYDINGTAGVQQATNAGPTDDQQATTNKNEKNEKKEKKEKKRRLCELLWSLILERKPDFRRPDLESWSEPMDAMLEADGRSAERIEAVIRWCRKDPFWSTNILTPASLRKHFDRLELEMGRTAAAHRESTREMVERMEREGRL